MQAQNNAGLVLAGLAQAVVVVVSVGAGGAEVLDGIRVGVGTQAQRVAAEGVAFGDLGGDEGEGGPERQSPGDADDGDEDGGRGRGVDEEGEGHAGGEEEVGEEPGAAEGEAGDLEAREEVADAVGFLFRGESRGEVFGHGGR